MRLPFRALTRNWQLKLAALALAVLLWVVVSAEQVTTQWIPVPVRVASGDPGRVVTGGPLPQEVEVRFAGAGRELWELALERPVLVLPVERVQEDSQVFVLDPRMVRIPNGLRSVTPLDVRPASVRVLTQRLVSRDLPVRVRIAQRSRDRYVVLDTPTVRPATVRVTGPADRVARLGAVVTEPLEIGAADSAFRRGVALDADSLEGVRASTRSVEVAATVDRVVERIFPAVPVAGPAGAVVLPERVDVRVQGPSRQVRALDVGTFSLSVSADSLPPGGALLPVRLGGVPAGLTARVVPATVRVAPAAAPPEAPAAPAPDSAPAAQPVEGAP
ncbi:MAG: CdaR family protein [Gemmatimonadota bacterium]